MFFPEHISQANGIAMICTFVSVMLIIVWRLEFHLANHSHARRLIFHVILLCMIALQLPFWISTLSDSYRSIFGIGLALLVTSVSLMFMCIFILIFQWAQVLSAGLVRPGHVQTSRKWKLRREAVDPGCR